ncbi:MAG TPA: ECF transporter S component [Acetivibrio sp.]|uniref:ECF transporter S component n=1 Tax=Acetivibrio sp. TaxID=1872092 RepID=UPI002B5B6EBD|nr:ECF transporter S component [Acetivibrio sp.]HOM01996.1 ECF transporter S component [Acetivibrio sp.]
MSNSNRTNSTRKIAINGMMIALVFLATYVTKIPTAVGPFNLGDSVIIIAAVLLGRKSGSLAGAIGSAIADIAMGYQHFAPVTFVVKGLEGFVAGFIVYALSKRFKEKKHVVILVASVAASIVMVSGYFFAELYVMRLFDETMGIAAALRDLPVNLVQGGACAVVGYILSVALDRFKVTKFIAN